MKNRREFIRLSAASSIVAGTGLIGPSKSFAYHIGEKAANGLDGHAYCAQEALIRMRDKGPESNRSVYAIGNDTIQGLSWLCRKIDFLEVPESTVNNLLIRGEILDGVISNIGSVDQLAYAITGTTLTELEDGNALTNPFQRLYADLGLQPRTYRAYMHGDRGEAIGPNATEADAKQMHTTAYIRTMAWVRYAFYRATRLLKVGGQSNIDLAAAYCAFALHTCQDLATHSNLVDLNYDASRQIIGQITVFYGEQNIAVFSDSSGMATMSVDDAVNTVITQMSGRLSLPEAKGEYMKVTGFADGPNYNPDTHPTLSYNHGASNEPNSKDGPGRPEGAKTPLANTAGSDTGHPTKYLASRNLGVDFTYTFLLRLYGQVPQSNAWINLMKAFGTVT